MKPRAIAIFTLAVLAGFAVTLVFANILTGPYTYRGSVINPPIPAEDFTLIDHQGRPFTLSEQKGKVVLLFFGYTFCPDVCPTTLSDMRYALSRMEDERDDVVFAMVTVDPERDSAEALGAYVANFSDEFIGLRTDDPVLTDIIHNAYGVFVEKQDTGSETAYLVEHTARVYVIDRKGDLRLTFPFGIDRTDIADDLLHLIRE